MRARALLGLLLLVATSCGKEDGSPTANGGPEYLPNTSPENLIANVVMAWEAKDAATYAALLYSGESPATDGAYYAPFKFHFAEGADPALPAFWVESRETVSAQRMFGGLAGEGLPGIAAVAMTLSPIGSWGAMGGDEIAGDSFPDGAEWCLFSAGLLITLEEPLGYSGADQIQVSGRVLFQCLPVHVAGITEWRLWKWWDETDRLEERSIPVGAVERSLSEVKASFAPASPAYLPNDSPEHLVANLVLAWEALDPLGYAALLYDGGTPATDGELYAPFSFGFDQSVDATLPDHWTLPAELACQETLLGEEPGAGVTGAENLAIELVPSGDWQAVAGGEVEGDPCPAEALWQAFDLDLLLVLKAPFAEDILGFTAQDEALLYCLPVQVGGGSEWRLWKWREVADGRPSAARPGPVKRTLGQIKVLYCN